MNFNFSSLILILGGIYMFLAACGVVKASRNSEANEKWHKKYGKFLKIVSPIVILFGIVEFFGLFD